MDVVHAGSTIFYTSKTKGTELGHDSVLLVKLRLRIRTVDLKMASVPVGSAAKVLPRCRETLETCLEKQRTWSHRVPGSAVVLTVPAGRSSLEQDTYESGWRLFSALLFSLQIRNDGTKRTAALLTWADVWRWGFIIFETKGTAALVNSKIVCVTFL